MDNNFYLAAGERIRTLREQRGLSREALSEIASISSKFLYEIEVGKKGFSAEVLVRISEELQVNCEYIIRGISEQSFDKEMQGIPNRLTGKKKRYLEEIIVLLCKALKE